MALGTHTEVVDNVLLRQPRLVGRDRELRAILDALNDDAATVLIEGEAGVGKSRLLREVLQVRTVQSRGPLVASCQPYDEAMTLQPIVDAIRQSADAPRRGALTPLAGVLRSLLPEWSNELPADPGPLDDPGAARHRLFRAFDELFSELGVEILIIEDAHWADEATLSFLLFLAGKHARRLTMLLTYRPEEVPSGSALSRLAAQSAGGSDPRRIRLAGLSVSATAELISSMLDDESVSEAFATFMHRHTDGLPLALEESVRLMGDRRDLVRSGGEWVRRALTDISVPSTIRDAVLERLARQPSDVREILFAASILSDPADDDLIRNISGLVGERSAAAFAAALRGGLLVEYTVGKFGFRHTLAARAVRDDMPLEDRRALHLRVAEYLEGETPPPLSRLAHHFREAGTRERWRHYAEKAGDLALLSGDYQAAVTMMQNLLAEGQMPTEDLIRWCQKFPVFACTGYLGGTGLTRTLRSVIGDPCLDSISRGRVRLQLGRMLIQTGEYGSGASELERGISDLDDHPLEIIGAMSALAGTSGQGLPVEEQRRWLHRVTELTKTALPEEWRLRMLVERTTAVLGMGDPTGWKIARKIPVAVASPRDAVDLTRADLNIGDEAIRWGYYEEAKRRISASYAAARGHGLFRMRDLAAATMIHLDWHTGRWEGLAERAHEAALAAGDEPLIRLDASLVIGQLKAIDGEMEEASDLLNHVLLESRSRGVFQVFLEAAAAFARVQLALGNLDEALRVSEEGWDAVIRKGVWLAAAEIAPIRSETLVKAGEETALHEMLTALEEGAADSVSPLLKASLLTCRARIVDEERRPATAAGKWAKAAAAWKALPRPYESLRATEAEARCVILGGNNDDGKRLMSAVSDGLRQLGALEDAKRVELTMANSLTKNGARPGRRGPIGYGDQLSPRELEVVRLMLAGLTNPEIARMLARSPKTIAAQLKSAMRKHGVASRTGLAVSAMNSGISPAPLSSSPF